MDTEIDKIEKNIEKLALRIALELFTNCAYQVNVLQNNK